MNNIPKKVKDEILQDPFYRFCARAKEPDEICIGRITWEHALLYGGKQVQEKFAIIPLCEYHHLGDGLDKSINVRIALSRAAPQDLWKYPRQTWTKTHPEVKSKTTKQ